VNENQAAICSGGLVSKGVSLRLVAGKWKVTHLARSKKESEDLLVFLGAITSSCAAVTSEINAGRITTADDALARLEPAIKEALRNLTHLEDPPLEALPPAPDPAPDMTGDDLVKCLGKPLGSEEGNRLIETLHDLPALSTSSSLLFVSSYVDGIDLAFKGVRGELSSIVFYINGVMEHRRYPGQLPRGLSLANTRRIVESKLGPPPQSGGGRFSRYKADYPALGISVEYLGHDARDPENPIACVAFRIPDSSKAAADSKAASEHQRLVFRLERAPSDAKSPVEIRGDPDDALGHKTIAILPENILDDSGVAGVYPELTEQGKFNIGIEFTPEAAARLERVSSAAKGRRIGIFLDGQLVSAPIIRGTIGRSVMIDPGNGSEQSLKDLTGRLHAAVFALPSTQPVSGNSQR
jgi:hypothetical protein